MFVPHEIKQWLAKLVSDAAYVCKAALLIVKVYIIPLDINAGYHKIIPFNQ